MSTSTRRTLSHKIKKGRYSPFNIREETLPMHSMSIKHSEHYGNYTRSWKGR